VAIGTGLNLAHYPAGVRLTWVDGPGDAGHRPPPRAMGFTVKAHKRFTCTRSSATTTP
jgi:hypothetical protein